MQLRATYTWDSINPLLRSRTPDWGMKKDRGLNHVSIDGVEPEAMLGRDCHAQTEFKEPGQ
jgi:hypothetical protein